MLQNTCTMMANQQKKNCIRAKCFLGTFTNKIKNFHLLLGNNANYCISVIE